MLNLFKNFGKGVLYVLVLPLLLAVLALYAVGALFVFIFLAIKGLILFFTGRSLYEDLPEDKEAKKRIAASSGETINQEIQAQKELEESDYVGDEEEEESAATNNSNIDNDPFYIPDYLKTEEQKQEVYITQEAPKNEVKDPIPETEMKEEIQPNPEPVMEEEKPIFVQKNPQNAGILEINDDEDDDSDDDGITIDFD